jgi:dTDP-4-amino-4,6-dideoxygalactose transaminase
MKELGAMRVPLVDLGAQYESIREDLLAAVTRVCDSQRYILGPEVELAEQELAKRLSATHAIGVSSGTDALLVSLMALGVRPGDEVVTSTYSFFASAGSIARLGATPVFVDIDLATFNLDPKSVKAAITPKTKVIMPVHLFGLAAPIDPILEAAAEVGIPVLEDACQAVGARYREKQVGTLGALGCISFFPSKALSAFGDGGLVVTNDDELAARVRRLRTHGAESKYCHSEIGGNFRLDAMQAAILRVKAPHLPHWLDQRRQNAARYTRLFEEADVVTFGVELPVEPEDHWHTYHQYVIKAPRRDELRKHLEAHDVGTAVYYPVPLHRQECFAHLGYAAGSLPRAEATAETALALPMYPELTEEQQTHVVETMAQYLRMS